MPPPAPLPLPLGCFRGDGEGCKDLGRISFSLPHFNRKRTSAERDGKVDGLLDEVSETHALISLNYTLRATLADVQSHLALFLWSSGKRHTHLGQGGSCVTKSEPVGCEPKVHVTLGLR